MGFSEKRACIGSPQLACANVVWFDLVTLAAAAWIGIRQNQINMQLLELNFRLSLEITSESDRLNIFNRGKENVWIWGRQFGDENRDLTKDGRLIVPSGSYYILTGRLLTWTRQNLDPNGERYVPLNIFVTTDNGKRYEAKALLFLKMLNGKMTVHTQTLGFVESDWTR